MIVVADTSPVTALLTVGEAELLVRLFEEVLIPGAVARELRRSHPSLPPWLRIVAARNRQQIRSFCWKAWTRAQRKPSSWPKR